MSPAGLASPVGCCVAEGGAAGALVCGVQAMTATAMQATTAVC
jgi:hypothetical protein